VAVTAPKPKLVGIMVSELFPLCKLLISSVFGAMVMGMFWATTTSFIFTVILSLSGLFQSLTVMVVLLPSSSIVVLLSCESESTAGGGSGEGK